MGIGLLVSGPLLIAIGVPLSLTGNAAWRNKCGPNSSVSRCYDGMTATIAAHVGTGFSYAAGVTLIGLGAAQKGRYDVSQGRGHGDGSGLLIAGAVVLPVAVIGMGAARLGFWRPTPECETYACVQRYQTYSTATVGGLAILASAGAGMLMYGVAKQRGTTRAGRAFTLQPNISRSYAGLDLGGRF